MISLIIISISIWWWGRPHALTHWGRVTHICVSKLTTIGSDNGLSPSRRQAIIWSNAGILLNWTLGTNFSEILSEIDTFSFKQIRWKMSSGKWRPYCLGLNVLIHCLLHGMVLGWFWSSITHLYREGLVYQGNQGCRSHMTTNMREWLAIKTF